MGQVLYTSDLHFKHKKVAEIRGFVMHDDDANVIGDTVRHDAQVTENWNNVVGKDDIVWVLGDVCMASGGLDNVALLNGTKHLITGNHDAPFPGHRDSYKHQDKWRGYFASIQPFIRRKIAGVDCLMSHFPYAESGEPDHTEYTRYLEYRLRDEGLALVHGHTHLAHQRFHDGRQIHVGLDAWNLTPVPQSEVERLVRSINPGTETTRE